MRQNTTKWTLLCHSRIKNHIYLIACLKKIIKVAGDDFTMSITRFKI